MTDALDTGVEALIRDVAATVVMPGFGTLAAHDIEEKAPGDLVTAADRLAEERLAEGLARLLPEARVVGEEACAADDRLIDTIGDGAVWIVDPIDGTGNYAEGRPPFGIMIALLADGEAERGWIFDPVADRMLSARRGHGAFVDGARIRSRGSGAARPIAALGTRYLPPALCREIEARAGGRMTLVEIPKCAAEQYARVGLGANDVALYWRVMPWDHAPGALLLEESGGRAAWLDGRRYRPADAGQGMIAAATPRLWEAAAAILLGDQGAG